MEKGEIWIISLADSSGHEQVGTRPAIIISDTQSPMSIVVPVTSNLQALRFQHTLALEPANSNGLKEESVALVFQIRAVDKSRLQKKIGILDQKATSRIDDILRRLLKL
ncbi:MAG TPA: type II toxin-antitoxin system PemK/MazF family toxin [archaeon]|nr:type II toxin-antitoxin system PemK/MazF family toxin [archaeon]